MRLSFLHGLSFSLDRADDHFLVASSLGDPNSSITLDVDRHCTIVQDFAFPLTIIIDLVPIERQVLEQLLPKTFPDRKKWAKMLRDSSAMGEA